MNGRSEGEEWAARELDELRARRFKPSAWRSFIVNSFNRAAQIRAQRPALARQARGWSAVGAVAGVGVGAVNPRLRRQIPALMVWWLAVATMLDWHLGMVEGPTGEYRESLSGADALTLARLWTVPILAAAREPETFTALIVAMALTDTLDGPLARRCGATRLGRDLDRSADLAVLFAAVTAARREGWLKAPVTHLLLFRAGLPIAFVAGSYFLQGARPKANGFQSFRRLTPALIGGLAIAPRTPLTGSALVAIAAGWPPAAAASRICAQCLRTRSDTRPRRAAPKRSA